MKPINRTFLAFLSIFMSLEAYSQSPTYVDVDYVGNGNSKQFMDIYIPSGLTAPAPAVVSIHGGGWSAGSKGSSSVAWIGDTLLAKGYIFIDINYRLSGDTLFPGCLHDCKTAIRFLKKNALAYNIDTCRIGVYGKSAGAHLASLVATTNGVASMEGYHLGSTGVTSKVYAAVLVSTVSDFLQEQAAFPGGSCWRDVDGAGSSESILMGCAIQTCTAVVATANPITYVDSSDPPFYIAHGDADCTVPHNQSQLLYNSLTANGVPATLLIEPGKVHLDAFFKSASQKLIELQFFDTYMQALGSAGSITGASTVCAGSSSAYSVSPVAGAASYVWSVPSGAVISSGQGTTSITVTFASTSGNITLTANGICGATTQNTVSVTVNPSPSATITPNGPTTFCSGSSVLLDAGGGFSAYQWNNASTTQTVSISSAGNYSVTVTDGNGCSASSSSVNITVNALPNASITPSGPTIFCTGNSVMLDAGSGFSAYQWNNASTTQTVSISSTGNFSVTVTDGNGCTATSAPISVTVNPLPAISISGASTVCYGDPSTLTASGANTYLWNTSETNSVIIVSPTATTAYTVTGTDANGCANSAMNNITVLPENTFSQTLTLCSGQSLTVGSSTYTVSGTYVDILTASNSCDSTVTSNLTILPANTFSQTVSLCSGQSLTVGSNTYTTSGTYTDVLTASNGCDSTVNTNLTVSSSIMYSQNPILCSGQSFSVGSNTYTTSGTYSDTLVAAGGCDSIVTTNLTMLPANIFSHTITLCSGQTLTVGSNTYTISGTYSDTLTDANGCDSTVTSNLTVLPANTFSQTVTLCSWQSLSVGNNTYTTSGIYVDTLTASNGCDSTVTSNLTIILLDTSVTVSGITMASNLFTAYYQWIDCANGNSPIAGEINQTFTASATGSYAVIVTTNGCTDTSSCYNVMVTGISETTDENNFLVYPNPSNGIIHLFLFLSHFGEGGGEIELQNVLGEVIFSEALSPLPWRVAGPVPIGASGGEANYTKQSDSYRIDLSNQRKGIYFIKLKSQNSMAVKKVIVE